MVKYTFLFLLLLAGLSIVTAQPVKRLYIANDDHTDYMWTANEAKYDTAFVQMLDFYLKQIDSTKNNPPDFQARFNCDGSYWLRAYQKYRSPAQFNRLIAAVKSGHIGSPLNTLVSTYGAQPTEAVLRGMYYAGQLERQYKLRFTLAEAMENNTLPLGLSSLWAGSGAKYSWKGIGGYGSQMTYEYRANRRNQLYRYTGLDASSVLMKWYTYDGRPKAHTPFGGYAECRLIIKTVNPTKEIGQIVDQLDAYCDTISTKSTYPYNVAGAFGYGHDDLETYVSNPFIEAARNGTNASRKVRVSNEEDFFEDVARSYPKLPSESVSYGNEWDLYCASMNETTAQVRRSTEKLRAAEALASLVALKKPSFANHLTPAKELAWESFGMYWEHNWTADGPVKQPVRATWQNKLQRQITGYVDSLFILSANTLGGQIRKAANPRFFVFNPLSWLRNDIADLAYTGTDPVRVIDVATNKEVASQVVTKGGRRFVRIYAENIPSVGYKVFEIRAGTPTARPAAATVSGEYMQNGRYRLRLSPSGAITEIVDNQAKGRQLVKPIDGKYVNDLGVSNVNDGNPVVAENVGPVSVTLKAVSLVPVPHTVRVTLFANSRTAGPQRIEIEDSIQANFADVKTWAFSFNLAKPTTRHEEVGAILTAKKETRGGHYAAQNARLDWQTFNHFADMSEANYGVTLSNVDCSFFKLGRSTVDSLWEQSSQLSALAGGQVDTKREDKGVLGIFGQNGQKGFRYQFALTTHAADFEPVVAMKFSLEHQNPLVTGPITGSADTYPASTFSLLNTGDPKVLLWSLKPAEDGDRQGLVARLWNIPGKPVSPVLQLALPIRQAWQTTHIETNERLLKPTGNQLRVSFAPTQLNTYRLQFTN
ncbi:glycosyl hydrolase-related protein [Spirosoma fluviale]|uniref:Alpha-mannosidase n=1 Tax=Spirosoma fluviale TaxID=1597977 RepID=A0A286GUZ2_9BACT|nr:glycosyl hydrolase-related protein [Spirosoma fluviale]SOD99292.1 alpha-mannosidase [Spirosoma fluviale]